MVIVFKLDFDDAKRESIALYMHRRYDEPLRKLATRKQCRQFVYEALDNQEIAALDVAALEYHCAKCD